MGDIRFACEGCQQSLEADESLAGVEIKCPACAELITIPEGIAMSYSESKPMTRRIPLTARSRLDRRFRNRGQSGA